jgi:DNA-binding response OmpR family regulator
MKRILVIDDDEIVNEMLVQLLTEAGYEAESARDGSLGMKLFAAKPFDLVVADIVMPDRDGIETIRDIRRTSKTIPIISMSGGGKIMNAERYLELATTLGANHAVQKPIDTEEFLGVIRMCLQGL